MQFDIPDNKDLVQIEVNSKKRKADDTIEDFIVNTASGGLQEDEITRVDFLDFDNIETPK